jgi:hypothetical protein
MVDEVVVVERRQVGELRLQACPDAAFDGDAAGEDEIVDRGAE